MSIVTEFNHFYPSIDRDNLSIDLIDCYIDYYCIVISLKIMERIYCCQNDNIYIEILKKFRIMSGNNYLGFAC